MFTEWDVNIGRSTGGKCIDWNLIHGLHIFIPFRDQINVQLHKYGSQQMNLIRGISAPHSIISKIISKRLCIKSS